MDSDTPVQVSRRQVLGLGAVAGAATLAAVGLHTPMAGASGISVSSGEVKDYTAVTRIPGLQASTLGYADFQALATGANNSTTYADPPSVYNGNGTGVQASLRLAVGSVLRRVDFFAVRAADAPSPLTFNLYQSTVPSSATRTSIGTQTLSATGQAQGFFDLGVGITIGLGDVITLEATPTNIKSSVVGALYQYAPAGGIYVPIAPRRVYDSRQAVAGKIVANETRTISVANEIASNGGTANIVPAGATGVAYNLTITASESTFGYLTVVAGGAGTAGPSSINWDHKDATLANGLQGPLNGSREVSVFCGGDSTAKTHLLIDILGYYL